MKGKIGFVGLGIMGMEMASCLLKADYEVTVYNRTRSKAEELLSLGAKIADTPSMAAKGSEVVITMLADPGAVDEAVLGRDGVIGGLESGAILIDCSTVDPVTSSKTLAAATETGARFLDSPVAGSKDDAANGNLILMVGGDKETLDDVREVLDVISSKIIYAGPSGSGTMLKLCFNLMVSHMIAALGEALVFGVKSGLKPELILDTIMAGRIAAPVYEWKGNCIIDRDFSTKFSTKLIHKDLNLILSAAYSLDTPLPVTAAVKELYALAKARGLGEEDFCSVVKVLEESAGVKIAR
jgi:3-hydroxyisobutyrate dehydrogenase-like beta-hydroxyacid dehydrogenase